MKKQTAGSPRYGKLPARHDSRTLMYEKYVSAPKLPLPPANKHWEAKLPADWGMMGNYSTSDCTCASAGHMIMNWTGNASKKEKVIPDKAIIAAYSKVTGYDPATGANDYGANLLDVLNYWRRTGIGNDKLSAYVGIELGNHAQLKEAVFLFGGCYIGLQLPDTATPSQPIWTVPGSGPHGAAAPNPNRGHAVPIVGYDDRYLAFITWGKVKLMTWKFYDTYCDEAYALLSPDWFNKKDMAPAGFNWNALQKDMALITKPKKYFTSGQFSGVEATDAFAKAAIKKSALIVPISPFTWPDNLGPKVSEIAGLSVGSAVSKPLSGGYDALVLAYTDQELQALLEVFTGKSTWTKNTKKNWYPYTHNFAKFKPQIARGWTLALKAGIFGYLLPFTIGTKTIMVYKSELHPKNNGDELPFVGVITQLIADIQPALIITTGTAGAIGSRVNIGDVVITDSARLFCKGKPYLGYTDITILSTNNTELKSSPQVSVNPHYIDYANASMTSLSLPGMDQCYAEFKGDTDYSFLKKSLQPPRIYIYNSSPVPGPEPMDILSANFFSVDDNSNLDQMQDRGIMNDTDDAFVAYAIYKMPSHEQPKWISIRNASEPQIQDPDFPSSYTQAQKLDELSGLAGSIFAVYQYCTTINSAFACWAVVAGL